MYRDEDIPDIGKELAESPVTRIVEDVDCFTPRRVIQIEYSGPNIREIVKQAPRIMARCLRVTGTRIFLDDYYINVTDPNNITFHIFWHGIRGFDGKSEVWTWIRLKQGLLKPDGTGSVIIEFLPKLVTSWNKESFIQRNPIYDLLMRIYRYVYYDEQRRKYVNICKEWGQDMIKRMKEFLKLMETAVYPYP